MFVVDYGVGGIGRPAARARTRKYALGDPVAASSCKFLLKQVHDSLIEPSPRINVELVNIKFELVCVRIIAGLRRRGFGFV